MGRACSAYEREGTYIRFWLGKPEGKNHWGDLGIDDMIILRWIFRKCCRSMDWIDLDQYRDRWQAFVNAV
jgi:hypothetical protein